MTHLREELQVRLRALFTLKVYDSLTLSFRYSRLGGVMVIVFATGPKVSGLEPGRSDAQWNLSTLATYGGTKNHPTYRKSYFLYDYIYTYIQ
jgi:hypothetical protein